jgi:MFS family permease
MTGVGVGLDQLQRATPIVSAFLLGYVTTLPLVGRLADLRGRLPVLVGALLVFAVGSLVTATAHDLSSATVGRALQGIGGGGLVPATLALVADVWPVRERAVPLGVVGAVQEVGSVLGPLYGALVLAVGSWRTIFWVNVAAAVALAAGLAPRTGRRRNARQNPGTGAVAGLVAAVCSLVCLTVLLLSPTALTEDLTWGELFAPSFTSSTWTSPLALLALAGAAVASWAASRSWSLVALVGEVDIVGAALLAAGLGALVLAFATADPEHQAVSARWPLWSAAALAGLTGFAARQRWARRPLLPAGALAHPAAWGSLVVNLFVGAALVAALVDIPVFARTTRFPDSQLGAALTLALLLVAVPVGAISGGWSARRLAPRWVAAGGTALAALGLLAMSGWDQHALSAPVTAAELLMTGLGFGLAIAPVNAALLAATPATAHGVASALVVAARMVGMLAGLSVLTGVGLRVFYNAQHRIGSPLQLCPTRPTSCPAYEHATRLALVDELNAVFAGAAVCAAVATLVALTVLRLPLAPEPTEAATSAGC